MNSCVFEQKVLNMDVLCVRSWGTYILAGVGNNLLVYTRNSFKSSTQIFEDERIHGIYVEYADVLVRGGRKVAYVSICPTDDVNEGVQCVVLWKTTCKDWIQDLVYDGSSNTMGLVTAHNFYEFQNLKTGELIDSYSCGETSILYSSKVIGNEFEEIVIFSGTVFGEVLIWAPSLIKHKLVLQKLIGHDGAVFSIAVDTTKKIITSTSDDRSLRVWCVITNEDLSSPYAWKDSKIQLVHSLYGHTARVWKCLIVSDFYVTAGEDSELNIWRCDGKLVKSLTLHQEGGIRGLHYSTSLDGILTGGEDSGINLISWKFLTDELEPAQPTKTIEVRENFSTRVRFTRNGFVYTVQGGCVFVTDDSREQTYSDDNFLSYCVLEVSTCGDHVLLGSLKGVLVILNAQTKDVEFAHQVENGRIYSIHYMKEYVLVCGPEGRLSLYKHFNEKLDLVNVKVLPNCSERWSTCAAIHNRNLIVGDRMGNVHIYELYGNENVVRTFRKIHSSQGVTDVIKKDSWVALTIGRDGTVKTLTESLSHVTSNKLPMDMPWRIVSYNDDVLILGFSGSSLMIWSTKYREVIGSHDCGGGHRSADFKLTGHKLLFMYVKKKQIFTVNFKLNEVVRIRNGHHSKEINCLAILKYDPTTFVTGSEDTTLRVAYIEDSRVVVSHVLKTHTSSIRTLATFQMSSPERILFVSAGGKGQLVVWTYNTETKVTSEKFTCHLQKEGSSWRNFLPTNDPFTRFMCVDVTKFEKQYFIAAGCSDCQIRLFRYHKELTPLCSMSYTHCILKIAILNMGSVLYVASMGTDGRIVFWKITDWSNASEVGKFTLHQSGINCYHLEEIKKGKELLLYTGGDDNMVSASLIEVSDDEVNLKQLWMNTTAHSCQVTGIKVVKDIVLTTSVDQRIRVWKWNLEDEDLDMTFISQYLSQVPDSKGLSATLIDEGIISVIVYGKGLEVLKIDLRSEKTKAEHRYHCDLLASMFW